MTWTLPFHSTEGFPWLSGWRKAPAAHGPPRPLPVWPDSHPSPFSLLATDPETAKLSCASELSPCTPFSLHRLPPPLHPILSSQLLKLPHSDSPRLSQRSLPGLPWPLAHPHQSTCGPIYKLLSACWFLQMSLIPESRDRVLLIIMSNPPRVPGSHRVQRTE